MLKWVIVFVAGSGGGALCDQIHVQSGVLAYPHPWVADQAWWVAPQFGLGMIVVLATARAVTEAGAAPTHHRRRLVRRGLRGQRHLARARGRARPCLRGHVGCPPAGSSRRGA